MPDELEHEALADCAIALAEEIARAAPDCADKALRIVEIVNEMKRGPDLAAIQDAIELQSLDGDLSDPKVHLTTAAVLDAVKRPTQD